MTVKPLVAAIALAVSASAIAQQYYMVVPLKPATASKPEEKGLFWLQAGENENNALLIMEGPGYSEAYRAGKLNLASAEIECVSTGTRLTTNASSASADYAAFSFSPAGLGDIVGNCSDYVLHYSSTQPPINLVPLLTGSTGGAGSPTVYPGEASLMYCGVVAFEAGTVSPSCDGASEPEPETPKWSQPNSNHIEFPPGLASMSVNFRLIARPPSGRGEWQNITGGAYTLRQLEGAMGNADEFSRAATTNSPTAASIYTSLYEGSEARGQWLNVGPDIAALTYGADASGGYLTGTISAPAPDKERVYFAVGEASGKLGRSTVKAPALLNQQYTQFVIIPAGYSNETAACVSAKDPRFQRAGVPFNQDFYVATISSYADNWEYMQTMVDDVTAVVLRQHGKSSAVALTSGDDAQAAMERGAPVRRKVLTLPPGLTGIWSMDFRNNYGTFSQAIWAAQGFPEGEALVNYTIPTWAAQEMEYLLPGCPGVEPPANYAPTEGGEGTWGNWEPVSSGVGNPCQGNEVGYCQYDSLATNCSSWSFGKSGGLYIGCARRSCAHPTINPSFIPGCT